MGALIGTFVHEAEPVQARPLTRSTGRTLPDPDDLPFLGVAVAGLADALVNGNPPHFPTEAAPDGLDILSPRVFLDRLTG